jgi:hypothetical protein
VERFANLLVNRFLTIREGASRRKPMTHVMVHQFRLEGDTSELQDGSEMNQQEATHRVYTRAACSSLAR